MRLSDKVKPLLFWLLTAALLMLLCAGFTSPLYPHYTGVDTSVFLTISRGILSGKIPYRDLFDHKGPVFYWMEALGYFFGGRTGVFLLQCLLLFCDIVLLRRIASLFHANLLTLLVPFFSAFFYLFQHGNLTEEFCMPLVLAGVYYELKYLSSENEVHPAGYAFLYGILLGLLAFIRVNNAVILCALLLCIAVCLLRRKQWLNLLHNLLLGTLGLAAVTVPVCWYFYRHGALYDMLYGTFIYNMVYANVRTHYPIFSPAFLYFLPLYTPGLCACMVFFIRWKQEKTRLYASLLFATVLTYGMLTYSNTFMHYFLLGIPLFAIAVAAAGKDQSLAAIWKNAASLFSGKSNTCDLKTRVTSVLLAGITALYMIFSAASACAPIYKTYLSDIAYNEYAKVQAGISVIPEEERNSVIAFETSANFYYHAGIIPCYKYFTFQRKLSIGEVNAYKEFLKNIILEHPLWVITETNEDDYAMRALLTGFYTCKWSDDTYSYYRYTG